MFTGKLSHGSIGAVTTQEGLTGKSTARKQHGIVLFGPYARLPAGRYRAEFAFGIIDSDTALGDPVAAIAEIVANKSKTFITHTFYLASQIDDGVQNRYIEFELAEEREIECRLVSTGQLEMFFSDAITFRSIPLIDHRPLEFGSVERALANEREFLDGYLRNVAGVIHVGANVAQERRYYWLIGVDVIWVEPIPEIYDRAVDNIARYPRQRIVNALLAERDGDEFEFRIANNNAASSSILELEQSAVMWPGIKYVETRKFVSSTLPTVLEKMHATPEDYQALTIDAEGAELLILKGAENLLSRFKYIKCEVSDFPSRTGTPTVEDLEAFLSQAGFRQLSVRQFANGPDGVGTWWDIVWKRINDGEPFQSEGVVLPIVINPHDVSAIEKCE